MVLLFNQEFGVLFWVGLPIAVWLRFFHQGSPQMEKWVNFLSLFALVIFICVGYAAYTVLPLNPRYFMLVTISIALLAGLGIAELWQGGRRSLAVAATFLILGGNVAGLYVENTNYMFGEHSLDNVAAQTQEQVFSDPETVHRAALLLKWHGTSERVHSTPPPKGGLYLYNPARATAPNPRMSKAEIPMYAPRADWKVVAKMQPREKLLGSLLAGTVIEQVIPGRLWKAISHPQPGVTLYRIPI